MLKSVVVGAAVVSCLALTGCNGQSATDDPLMKTPTGQVRVCLSADVQPSDGSFTLPAMNYFNDEGPITTGTIDKFTAVHHVTADDLQHKANDAKGFVLASPVTLGPAQRCQVAAARMVYQPPSDQTKPDTGIPPHIYQPDGHVYAIKSHPREHEPKITYLEELVGGAVAQIMTPVGAPISKSDIGSDWDSHGVFDAKYVPPAEGAGNFEVCMTFGDFANGHERVSVPAGITFASWGTLIADLRENAHDLSYQLDRDHPQYGVVNARPFSLTRAVPCKVIEVRPAPSDGGTWLAPPIPASQRLQFEAQTGNKTLKGDAEYVVDNGLEGTPLKDIGA